MGRHRGAVSYHILFPLQKRIGHYFFIFTLYFRDAAPPSKNQVGGGVYHVLTFLGFYADILRDQDVTVKVLAHFFSTSLMSLPTPSHLRVGKYLLI